MKKTGADISVETSSDNRIDQDLSAKNKWQRRSRKILFIEYSLITVKIPLHDDPICS
jgi:hypothetical protein